jgi:hypothetical protein
VSRVELGEGLSGGSLTGLMSEVMLVWVRVRSVHVRLVTIGMMSTYVLV